MAAALASFVSWMPPSETMPIPGIEVANAKVKAWRRGTRKGKWKDAPLGTMFGAMSGGKRPRYLMVKPTCRRWPNHLYGNPTGCLENLRLRRNRRSMNA